MEEGLLVPMVGPTIMRADYQMTSRGDTAPSGQTQDQVDTITSNEPPGAPPPSTLAAQPERAEPQVQVIDSIINAPDGSIGSGPMASVALLLGAWLGDVQDKALVERSVRTLQVPCEWAYKAMSNEERTARQKRRLNQSHSPAYLAVVYKDKPAMRHLMTQEPQLRGFMGETTMHSAFLLADTADGWDVCKWLVDAFPQRVTDEYVRDSHRNIDALTTLINRDWGENKSPLGDHNPHKYVQMPLANISDTRSSTSLDVWEHSLPGLYTGENVLHIAIVSRKLDMVKYLLNHKHVTAQQKRRLLTARAHGSFFLPRVFSVVRTKQSSNRTKVKTIVNDESRCYMGEFPYTFACCRGDIQIMDVLWNMAVELNVSNSNFFHKVQTRVIGVAIIDQDRRRGGNKVGVNWSILRHAVMVDWQRTKRINGLVPVAYKTARHTSCNAIGKEQDVEYMRPALRLYPRVPNQKAVNIAFCQDCFGNTALHLAVDSKNTAAIDLILDKHCPRGTSDAPIGLSSQANLLLRRLNNECMTPLTHAIRGGHVDMFEHVKGRMKKVLWVYGDIKLEQHPLEQFDTHRSRAKLSYADQLTTCLSRRAGYSLSDTRLNKQDMSLEYSNLHKHSRWVSGIEIITRYEVKAFAQHPDYVDALDYKWNRFARNTYLLVELIPQILTLVAFKHWHIDKLSASQDAYAGSDGGSEVTHHPWKQWLHPRVYYLVLFMAYQTILSVYQLKKVFRLGWRRSIDIDLNGNVSLSEVVSFVFKIIDDVINVLIAAVFIVCLLSDSRIYFAIMALMLWLRLALVLVPFNAVGLLLNTMVQMFIIDVLPFLCVFLLILFGFADGLSILHTDYTAEDSENDLLSYAGQLYYTFLGELHGAFDTLPFDGVDAANRNTARLMWATWCLLSTIVAINLLIAKMSSTYEKIEVSARTASIFPRARVILHMETVAMRWLPLSWTIHWRYGEPSEPSMVDGTDLSIINLAPYCLIEQTSGSEEPQRMCRTTDDPG